MMTDQSLATAIHANLTAKAKPGLTSAYEGDDTFRILSLDGGGAKGVYTLGVLREIEGMIKCPLYKKFDLVFGTSTGAIIAALIGLGYGVDAIHGLYKKHVPKVMKKKVAWTKSRALGELADEVFGRTPFSDFKTRIGIVTTKWVEEKPMIFKSFDDQAHGRTGTFIPGFGATVSEAVQASCSAHPFFKRKIVKTTVGECDYELIDGGYCANNPTLYAIADATEALKKPLHAIRVVSLGVGVYPTPPPSLFWRIVCLSPGVQVAQKALEVNTQSMEQLTAILYKDIRIVRINETFSEPEMAADMFEHDTKKLNLLYTRGRTSFGHQEAQLKEFLT